MKRRKTGRKKKSEVRSGEQQVEVAMLDAHDDSITVVLMPGEKEEIVGLAFRFCIEENLEKGGMRAMLAYKRLWGKMLGVQQRMKARADHSLTKNRERSVERKVQKIIKQKAKSAKKKP